MHLLSAHLIKYKNINDLTVTFDERNPVTVFIGNNGSAKSNLLEALITIFRNADLKEPTWITPLKASVCYVCQGHRIEIAVDSEAERQITYTVDGTSVSRAHVVQRDGERLLPRFVFGYYSGTSTRMEALFDRHQELFYDQLINTDVSVEHNAGQLRPLFYARLVHSQFVLLAFLLQDDSSVADFLRNTLRIDGVESILFVMREPEWKSSVGDPRFWNARGEVSRFLSHLFEHSYAPLRVTQEVTLSFRKKKRLQHLYMYLPDIDSLRKIYSNYESPQDFFQALESTYISKLLQEVRIRVRIRNSDDTITFRELSEGEQQLLVVMGLLRWTHEDESIYFLDEPDTHLNPAWSRMYLKILNDVVGDLNKNHIVMTTHNPLVFGSLKKEQVNILTRDSSTGLIKVQTPEENPRGLGVTGMLLSDMFRLPSAFDLPTEELFERARELDVMDEDGELTLEQKEERRRLQKNIEDLDVSVSSDWMQDLFVRSLGRVLRQEGLGLTLDEQSDHTSITPDKWKEIRVAAHAIVEDLVKTEVTEYTKSGSLDGEVGA